MCSIIPGDKVIYDAKSATSCKKERKPDCTCYITGFNRIHILNQNNGFIVNMK